MTPLLSSALLRAQTDERLVALAASGHDRAFEAIVERYRRPLLRYLRRMLSDTLAEDVVQATFINAWSSLHTGTEVRDLRPWLYRIAHNSAINALKKVGEAMEELPESIGGLHSEPEAELERRDEIRRALNSIAALPSRQRAALLAVAVEGRAHADVAAELGLTDGAVRQLVHRARSAVRTAATAITPMPLLHAVAASAGDSTLQRVAEVAAGAGGAGAASLSLKAGAAAVLATGALVTGGPDVAHIVSPPARTAPASPEPQTAAPRSPSSGPGGGASFASVTTGTRSGPSGASGTGAGSAGREARGERRRRRGRDADRRGPSDRSGPRHGATPAAGHSGRPHPAADGDEHADRGPGSQGGPGDDGDELGGINGRGKSVSGGAGGDPGGGGASGGGGDVVIPTAGGPPKDRSGSGVVGTPPTPAGDGGPGGSGSGSGGSGGSGGGSGGGPSTAAAQVPAPPASPAPTGAAAEVDSGGSGGGSGASGGTSGSGGSG
ncbi:MAG: hypothetical protein QOD81_1825 [Solirubrobacteraceae bacterium]|jgi:RNA polymerase sigma factor (sigma-70 family)|nr:hypothetical protein [Solirubrobacteraceae bacterium]